MLSDYERAKRWKLANPGKAKEHAKRASKKARLRHGARLRAGAKHRREQNPGKGREDALWFKYKITRAEADALETKQDGHCAICSQKDDLPGVGKRLHVDHCGDSGKIRGLLCQRCNVGIGFFRHDSRLIELAAEYLRRQKCHTHADGSKQV